jgi:hypothetical protein
MLLHLKTLEMGKSLSGAADDENENIHSYCIVLSTYSRLSRDPGLSTKNTIAEL